MKNMQNKRLFSLSAALATSISLSFITVPARSATFRVNPYLQQPSSDGMYFTWFTEADITGTLAITGPELRPLTAPPPLNRCCLTQTQREPRKSPV